MTIIVRLIIYNTDCYYYPLQVPLDIHQHYASNRSNIRNMLHLKPIHIIYINYSPRIHNI